MAYIKKNPRLAIAAAVLLVLAVGIAAWVLISNMREQRRDSIVGLRVYTFDAGAGLLVATPTTIPATGTHEAQLLELLNRFWNHNRRPGGLWPPEAGYVDLYFSNGTAGIALSAAHGNMPAFQEGLFRAALAMTFLELWFVEEVLFWIDGTGDKNGVPFRTWLEHEEYRDNSAIRIENADTVDNNPSISPGVMRERDVTLYFLNPDGTGLITETLIDVYVDILRWIEFTIDMLVAGIDDDYFMRVIPSETRVRWITRDTDTRSVYVDLSEDFMSQFEGTPQQAGLMLQSIVNTLTLQDNNPDTSHLTHTLNPQQVNQVFFFINSDRHETFHGVLDFDLAFTYNHEILFERPYVPEPYDPYYDPYYEDEPDIGPRGDDDE
ncbi:MAG: GerMN domain-containing protein [Defluviitaleaceae bacterium]|nr:GerMN domain-containing protein [Defluviitaleaceae bacterium]